MKKKIIIVAILLLMVSGCSKYREYSKKISINNLNINIYIYEKNENKANQALKDITKIYNNYDILLTDYNTKEKITMTERLKKIVSVGNSFKKYDNYIKFNPEISNNLLNKKNSEINFYINGITNSEVYNYLKNKGISKFKISSTQFVLTGFPSGKDYYNIAIASPFDDSVIKVLKSKNEYIVTKNINDPNFNSSNFNKNTKNISVSVITDDISNADYIASLLLLMPVDEGKKLAEKYNVEAIWCYITNNKQTVEYTDGLK